MLLRVNRKKTAAVAIAALLAVMAAAVSASAGLSLWDGGEKKGDVASRTGASNRTEIAAEQALSAMNVQVHVSGLSITASLNKKKLEMWGNSDIVRINGTVYTAPAPLVSESGHWWVDSEFMLDTMTRFLVSAAERPQLRLVSDKPTSVTSTDKKVIRRGKKKIVTYKTTTTETVPAASGDVKDGQ